MAQLNDLIVTGRASFLNEIKGKIDWTNILSKPTIPAAVAVKGNAETSYRTGNVNITPANIGLGNVGNFKAVSTVASQGLTSTEQSNARANIGAGTSNLTIGTSATTAMAGNTNVNNVTQTPTDAGNYNYEILFSNSGGNDQENAITRKSRYLMYNATSRALTISDGTSSHISVNGSGDITLIASTWDGTNTSLKTAVTNAKGTVTQTATTTNANYELLFSGTSDNTTRTEGTRKSNTLLYNPSKNELSIQGSLIARDGITSNGTISVMDSSNTSHNNTEIGYDMISLYDTTSGVDRMMITHSDIEFDSSNTPNTWDGTNTSLKTAVSSKLNKAGDTMTGALTFNKVTNAIHYTGSKADYTMIQFIDNTSDTYGNGIAIGGGGQTIIGGGESATVMKDNAGTSGAEEMWIGNDGDVHIYTNLQNGWANRNDFQFTAGKNFFLPSGGGVYFPNDGIINFQSNTTSEATGDICWSYSNTKEKARIWCDGSFTSAAGLNYRCYNSSGTQLYSGRLQIVSSSDIRLKENITDTEITNALSTINQIKLHAFDWKTTGEHQTIGMIADEIEELDPHFLNPGGGGVDSFGEINPKTIDTYYVMNYMLKAIQELSAEVDELKAQLNKTRI